MQTLHRHFLGLFAVAAISFSGGNLLADEIKSADTTPKAQASPTPLAVAVSGIKSDDKSVKQDAASASKVDLNTPTSKLNFYGEADMGVVAGKVKCAGAKSQSFTGEYYNLMLGTDIKLTNNITMGIQVQSGRGLANFH